MPNYLFTSESVSVGHPDKIADQVSDAILDAYLTQDPDAKVACECLITTQHLVIAGEVHSSAKVDVIAIAKQVIHDIGYNHQDIGFDYATATYTNLLHQQSREIHDSVSDGGAGDQGLMFGYACKETPELMPLPIIIAHQLMRKQAELRQNGSIDWLLPDAKSQVTVAYTDNIATGIESVVLSTQHKAGINQEFIRKEVIAQIIRPVLQHYFPEATPDYLINPSGHFTIGGPHGDTGLTGRKIIVDTYGGMCAHGGGAFSGKDPSKVDRSGAYAARYVAKHLVAAGIAERCTVQISYAIGKTEPTSILLDFHHTGKISETCALIAVRSLFDLTPNGIIETLGLKHPLYSSTAVHGHFGNESLPWEKVDERIVERLTTYLSLNKSLLHAYFHTAYSVFNPAFVIRIGARSPEADQLLEQHNATAWAYITSANPESAMLPSETNDMHFESLCQLLQHHCCYHGEGRGEDLDWPTEKSVFIPGITQEEAIRIAREFNQLAIVTGKKGRAAELIITGSSLHQTPCLDF